MVIVVQENRTFDNLFGGPHGFPGADTASYGLSSQGKRIPLVSEHLEDHGGPNNSHLDWVGAYNGGAMNGFDKNSAGPGASFKYVVRDETLSYWDMATKYAIGDRTFGDNNGPTYVAHQYLIAGQSHRVAEDPGPALFSPVGCDSPPGTTTVVLNSRGEEVPGPFPCFGYLTVGELLNAKGYEWRYYLPLLGDRIGGLNAYESIRNVFYGNQYGVSVITPETTFLSDVASSLSSVTWVTPGILNSDHPGYLGDGGPSWVASVVNAIGESPFWSSTVILVIWDDWGGLYDHVRPKELSYMGRSFRVPLIVISPFVKRGYISHRTHAQGSILHFIEKIFHLPSLHTTDGSSDDLSDFFDFNKAPAPFVSVEVNKRHPARVHGALQIGAELRD